MSAEKFNVGDKVLVKSLDWYNENKDEDGIVHVPCNFVRGMSELCGKVLTITHRSWNSYSVKENGFSWSDQMFERALSPVEVFAETKDVKYLPKTYEECCKVLGIDSTINHTIGTLFRYRDTIKHFIKLHICRDAYWKLANNWAPDYTDTKTKKHCIVTRRERLSVATTTETNRVFAFPTPEMAEMFVKNFGGDLNLCKEYL
jgi:hypothetical protein